MASWSASNSVSVKTLHRQQAQGLQPTSASGMRVHRVTRTCPSSLIQKGPRMGQTWPIPEAHGHGALVTAERCFGIDMRTGRRFFLGLSAPLKVQASIINACMKQLRAYQTRLVERKTCSKVSKVEASRYSTPRQCHRDAP